MNFLSILLLSTFLFLLKVKVTPPDVVEERDSQHLRGVKHDQNIVSEMESSRELAASTSCSAYGYTGTCKSTTDCTSSGGGSVAGFCSGASNIQCCMTVPCTTSGKRGYCWLLF